MAYSWSKPFFSHPGRLLKDHLKDVGEASANYVKAAKVKDKVFIRAAEIVGKTHDFGKYSTLFQRHLQGEQMSIKSRSHSPLSAIFASWVINRELKDPFLTATAYLCVLRHHGNLINFNDTLDTLNQFLEDSPTQLSQLNSIKENLPRISTELTEIGINGTNEFFENTDEVIRDIRRVLFTATKKSKLSWDHYFKTLLLFSALIDADKKDAAKIKVIDRHILPSNLVDNFRKKAFSKQSPMDVMRSELYEGVMCSLDKLIDNQQSIMTITAPTGSGKTLLSLSIALRLRTKLTDQGDPPRIIYCLPFINIIEQTHDVFSRIITMEESKIDPKVLLKHHHLSIPVLDEEKSLHNALELQESWDSEIVVTTFVQLMHTLVGYRNSFLKKFHNLANAIIILDEVQTIPIEYWLLTKELFKNFTKNTSSRVIFMTATQPLIFREDEAKELVPDSSKYFDRLDRNHLHYISNEMTIKEAANLIHEKWTKGHTLLVVVNTIKSSIELYEELKGIVGEAVRMGFNDEELNKTNKPVIAYLSTNITPKERTRRIKLLKEALDKGNRNVILVSTQVVEAGIDLDFNVVVRDIAPTDSINQVAGRCNRSSRLKKGEVYVIRLRDEEGNLYANQVYSKKHVEISSKILENKIETSEKDFLKMVKEFFQEQYNYEGAYASDESKTIIKNIENLSFGNLSDFKLIKDEPTEAVFVEYDEEATKTLTEFIKRLKEFREAGKSDDIFNKRAVLRSARVKLEEYIVNVRKRDCQLGEIIPETTIRHLKKEYLEEMYDRETGYRRDTLHPSIW